MMDKLSKVINDAKDKKAQEKTNAEQKERANWALREIEIICDMAAVKLEAVNVPQFNLTLLKQGSLKDCIKEYNQQKNDKVGKAIEKEAPKEDRKPS